LHERAIRTLQISSCNLGSAGKDRDILPQRPFFDVRPEAFGDPSADRVEG
jgi:hypothetical protein